MIVLGIQRKGRSFIGAPDAQRTIKAGDTLILYGKRAHLKSLEGRHRGVHGDIAHYKAVKKQKSVIEEDRYK